MQMQFKQFRPMNKLPISFDSKGQIDKMKDFAIKFVKQSEKEVKSTNAIL